MDGLSHFACHNIALPCNANGTCITAKAFETVWELIDSRSRCLAQNLKYKQYTRAMMYGLLYRIHTDFSTAIQNGSTPKFHLYSGHDTTVTPLITAMELKNVVWPRFATTITFELYRKQNSESLIRVLQDGKVVTGDVFFCKDSTNKHGMCPFVNLTNYINKKDNSEICNSLNFVPKRKRSLKRQ